MVQEGAAAPDFELSSEGGKTVRVAKAMYGVKPEGHPEQVLEVLPQT